MRAALLILTLAGCGEEPCDAPWGPYRLTDLTSPTGNCNETTVAAMKAEAPLHFQNLCFIVKGKK